MAPLTWRNVEGPNFNNAAAMLATAIGGFERAGAGIGGALTGLHDIQRTNRSAAALPILARVANEQGVDAALSNVEGSVDAQFRSPELLTAMANLRQNALGNERSRADTLGREAETAFRQGPQTALTNAQAAGVAGREGRDAQLHGRAITVEDQLARAAKGYLGAVEGGPRTFQEALPDILPGESGGDFNKLFNNAEQPGGAFAGVKISGMTVDEALEFQNPSGPYAQYVAKNNKGVVSTPIGGLQVIGDTLRDAKKGLGLKGDELLSEDMQLRIGEWIFDNQGVSAWKGYRAGSGSGGGAPRLSDFVGDDNAVPLDQLLTISDAGRASFNNQRTAEDANRDRDFEFDGAATGRARSEEEIARVARAEEWAAENTATLATADPVATERAILQDKKLPVKDRNARIAAYRGLLGNESLTALPRGTTQPAAEVAQTQAIEIASTDINRTFQTAQTILGDPAAELRTAGDTPATQQSILESQGAMENAGLDPVDMANLVEAAHEEFSVPRPYIAALMANSVKAGSWLSRNVAWGDDIIADKKHLYGILEKLADPNNKDRQLLDGMTLLKSRADAASAEYSGLVNQRNLLRSYNNPEDAGELARVNARINELDGIIRTSHKELIELMPQSPGQKAEAALKKAAVGEETAADPSEDVGAVTRSIAEAARGEANPLPPATPAPARPEGRQRIEADRAIQKQTQRIEAEQGAEELVAAADNLVSNFEANGEAVPKEAREAVTFFQLPAVIDHLQKNPDQLAGAMRSPVAYYLALRKELARRK